MNWSRIIGNIGRSLIAGGVLILLFVVYQLWGTAFRESRAQSSLRTEFAERLESSAAADIDLDATLPVSVNPAELAGFDAADTDDADQGQPPEADDTGRVEGSNLIIDPTELEFGPPPPPPDDGDAVARIVIPRIELDKVVVEGVGTNALKNGPGHYPGTPLPGQDGNAAIAGHRTTYGAPFGDLDELERDDLIYITTQQGPFQYRVTEKFVVSPSDVWVLDPSPTPRLTLTTCHPRFSARQRLIIVAELIGPAAPSTVGSNGEIITAGSAGGLPGEDIDGDEPPAEETTDTSTPAPTTTIPNIVGSEADPGAPAPPTEVVHGSIDGDRAAAWPALFWAAITALTWVIIWLVSHQWRRWPAYLLGTPVFLLMLFLFFENFSRLLPSGV